MPSCVFGAKQREKRAGGCCFPLFGNKMVTSCDLEISIEASQIICGLSKNARQRPMPNHRFLKWFGVGPAVATTCYEKYMKGTHVAEPRLLLYTLYFVKHYPNDSIGYTHFRGIGQKRFRHYVWKVLEHLGEEGVMTEIDENAAKFDGGKDVLLVDCTEVHVARPTASVLATALYSGYKKKTTLKYEVAIACGTHLPIHLNGPFCGPTADIKIFREELKGKMIKYGWYGFADGTYQGEKELLDVPPKKKKVVSKKWATKKLTEKERDKSLREIVDRLLQSRDPKEKSIARQRAEKRAYVEIFFSRMKKFLILSNKFRHSLNKHKFVFRFVANLVSIDLHRRPLVKHKKEE